MVDRGRYPALTVLAALVVLTGVVVVNAVRADAEANNSNDGSIGTCQESEAGLTVTKDGPLVLYHYATAESTQDEARAIVSLPRDEILLMIPDISGDDDDSDFNAVAVTATEQTKGRGTNGRNWMGARGNTFVTICIPQSAWRATSLSMTLLPIKIGIVMAQQVSKALDACQATLVGQGRPASSSVTIKWPNDVLVNEQKIAGVLIESTTEWFMIGIGVNVAHAPTVPRSGPNHGRPATCIQCHCPKDDSAPKPQELVNLARELGVAMAADLSQWLARCSNDKDTHWNAQDEQTHMLQQWRSFVDWDMQLVLRDSTDKQPMVPVDIEPDGRLRVQSTNGQQRLVVSDYFL